MFNMKFFFLRLLSALIFTCFCSMLVWYSLTYSNAAFSVPAKLKRIPAEKNDAALNSLPKNKQNPPKINKPAHSGQSNMKQTSAEKEGKVMNEMLANYNPKWKKQNKNLIFYRSLIQNCKAKSNALVLQTNSPVGTNLAFDGEKKNMVVKPGLFNILPKKNPFEKAPWDSCAVVGNGGIIANSGCGKEIDSATYVIRCNLPPLSDEHIRDTGKKTNLVTANPSILYKKYNGLMMQHQKTFVENLQLYENALILLPAFSFVRNTNISLRAFDFLRRKPYKGPQAVFHNPRYLKDLEAFWRGQGIQEKRLSTGIMMASLALELCNNVHLYGFWPFGTHPYTKQELSNHYYDNRPVNKKMHSMPSEFKALLDLHNNGVIHLHLGECKS